MNKIETKGLNAFYSKTQVLKDISISIKANTVTSFIGPSGCGKSTLLRSFNRMNDIVQSFHMNGSIYIDNKDIYREKIDITAHRKKVGMVFQKANPFPMSIYENVAYGLRVNNIKHQKFLDESVERSLKMAALWDEVKDILNKPAMQLSVGQQQRLCIARALAVEPSIVLMDEPASALDPISTAKIEELIYELKKKYTLLVVTHNMQQAARISDNTAFIYLGELIEYGDTKKIFTAPDSEQTENYITGRFG
jgi:phosphate transport system ATP-binding protein